MRRDGALRTEVHDGLLREPLLDVDVPGHPRSGEIDERAARKHRCVLGEVRVDALLPAVRPGGAEREPLGRAQDPERLEVRRLEEHLARVLRDLAVLAAHDRRERDGALAVGDEQVVRVEAAERPVERAELLAGARATDDDAAVASFVRSNAWSGLPQTCMT